jgi:hypothetical protein
MRVAELRARKCIFCSGGEDEVGELEVWSRPQGKLYHCKACRAVPNFFSFAPSILVHVRDYQKSRDRLKKRLRHFREAKELHEKRLARAAAKKRASGA